VSSIILNNSLAIESADKGYTNKLEGQKNQSTTSNKANEKNNVSENVLQNTQNTNADENITPEMTNEQLKMVAQQLQDFMGEMNKGLEFTVDKDSGRDVIKVIDKQNGDLIKQYPTEEVLDMVSKLSDATGSLINEKI
jgi:flagellar protein FlaG